jgi:hypothetical protein
VQPLLYVLAPAELAGPPPIGHLPRSVPGSALVIGKERNLFKTRFKILASAGAVSQECERLAKRFQRQGA